MIDIFAAGYLMRKSAKQAFELFKKMARSSFNWYSKTAKPEQVIVSPKLDKVSRLQERVVALATQVIKCKCKEKS